MAVQLGYKNVYRDPMGYSEWQEKGLSVASVTKDIAAAEPVPVGHSLNWSLFWTLLGVFFGGMALNLTPCVFPLVPLTVSLFAGMSGGSRGRLVAHGLFYLAGLAITNTALGVTAALTGGLMGALLQNPLVLLTVAFILLFFASSLFGFWELRLPQNLTQAAAKSYAGYFGTLFMGVTLGVVAAPCIGPFVLGLLTWVAAEGSAWLGFAVFSSLSLGLGLPLFFFAIGGGSLDQLPRAGEWMLWVRKLMGWVLVGLAVHFLRPLLPESWPKIGLALTALAASLHLGLLDRTTASFKAFAWLKAGVWFTCLLTAMLLLGSLIWRGPGIPWQPYAPILVEEAKQEQKPVILDFYAKWCGACRELEEITFHNPEVVQKAARDFVMIRIDLSRRGDPQVDRLLKRFQVKGAPTVVFLDPQGREISDLRLNDFLPPEQFLHRMSQALKLGPLP